MSTRLPGSVAADKDDQARVDITTGQGSLASEVTKWNYLVGGQEGFSVKVFEDAVADLEEVRLYSNGRLVRPISQADAYQEKGRWVIEATFTQADRE